MESSGSTASAARVPCRLSSPFAANRTTHILSIECNEHLARHDLESAFGFIGRISGFHCIGKRLYPRETLRTIQACRVESQTEKRRCPLFHHRRDRRHRE